MQNLAIVILVLVFTSCNALVHLHSSTEITSEKSPEYDRTIDGKLYVVLESGLVPDEFEDALQEKLQDHLLEHDISSEMHEVDLILSADIDSRPTSEEEADGDGERTGFVIVTFDQVLHAARDAGASALLIVDEGRAESRTQTDDIGVNYPNPYGLEPTYKMTYERKFTYIFGGRAYDVATGQEVWTARVEFEGDRGLRVKPQADVMTGKLVDVMLKDGLIRNEVPDM